MCLTIMNNLEAWREEGVEAHNEVRVAFEQCGHTVDHSRSVHLLHYSCLYIRQGSEAVSSTDLHRICCHVWQECS